MNTVDTGRHPVLMVVTGLLQLAAAAPYVLSGLIAPTSGQLAMWLIFLGFTGLAVVMLRRNARLAPAVSGLTVVVGVLCLVLGGTYLGWEG